MLRYCESWKSLQIECSDNLSSACFFCNVELDSFYEDYKKHLWSYAMYQSSFRASAIQICGNIPTSNNLISTINMSFFDKSANNLHIWQWQKVVLRFSIFSPFAAVVPSTTWNDLFCSYGEDLSPWHIFKFSSNLQTTETNLKSLRTVCTHFVSQRTWNYREMIAVTRSYIFRLPSSYCWTSLLFARREIRNMSKNLY